MTTSRVLLLFGLLTIGSASGALAGGTLPIAVDLAPTAPPTGTVPNLPHAPGVTPDTEGQRPIFSQPADHPLLWDGSGDGTSDIEFRCPEGDVDSNASAVAFGCPLYVPDFEDIMGQPVLLIDETDPDFDLVAFNAMHGGHGIHLTDNETATTRSRDDHLHQPHTTFQNTIGGVFDEWKDHFYHSPYRTNENEVYGEDNAATLDGKGRMHIASLYTVRNPGQVDFEYIISVWRGGRINVPMEYYGNQQNIRPDAPANRIDSLHMTYVSDADRVLLVWRESQPAAAVPNPLATPKTSWINAAWLQPGKSQWTRLPSEQTIGTCDAITGPVVHDGLAYIACQAGPGYPGAVGGTYYLHAIDVVSGTTRVVGTTFQTRGDAVLAPRPGGRLIMAAAGVDGGGDAFLEVSYAETGDDWTTPDDYGAEFSNLSQQSDGTKLLEARVTALGMAPASGNTHIILKEVYEYPATEADDYLKPTIWKAMGAISPSGFYQGRIDLELGDPARRAIYHPEYQGLDEGVFSDLHDSLVIVNDPTGEPHEFVAYGDYGYTRFSEVVETNFIPCCPWGPQAPPPIASPAAGPNMAQVGAVAGALATAMVGSLLLKRKKTAVEAPSL